MRHVLLTCNDTFGPEYRLNRVKRRLMLNWDTAMVLYFSSSLCKSLFVCYFIYHQAKKQFFSLLYLVESFKAVSPLTTISITDPITRVLCCTCIHTQQ